MKKIMLMFAILCQLTVSLYSQQQKDYKSAAAQASASLYPKPGEMPLSSSVAGAACSSSSAAAASAASSKPTPVSISLKSLSQRELIKIPVFLPAYFSIPAEFGDYIFGQNQEFTQGESIQFISKNDRFQGVIIGKMRLSSQDALSLTPKFKYLAILLTYPRAEPKIIGFSDQSIIGRHILNQAVKRDPIKEWVSISQSAALEWQTIPVMHSAFALLSGKSYPGSLSFTNTSLENIFQIHEPVIIPNPQDSTVHQFVYGLIIAKSQDGAQYAVQTDYSDKFYAVPVEKIYKFSLTPAVYFTLPQATPSSLEQVASSPEQAASSTGPSLNLQPESATAADHPKPDKFAKSIAPRKNERKSTINSTLPPTAASLTDASLYSQPESAAVAYSASDISAKNIPLRKRKAEDNAQKTKKQKKEQEAKKKKNDETAEILK